LNEVDQYASFLERGARADLQKAAKIRAFHEMVAAVAPDDDADTPINDLLAGFTKGVVA
jgi:hypothetical protein